MINKKKTNFISVTAILLVAIVAVTLGLWLQRSHYKIQVATILTQPQTIRPFSLLDDHNKPFTNKNLQDKWSLIFFGFTHCPHICPTTLSMLNEIYQQLQKEKRQPMPQIVFISVDPDRDTPKRIKNYLASFNKHFIGATGTKKQIDALTQDFKVVYMQSTFDHSAGILITNPKGQLYGIFSTPHNLKIIVQDLKKILRHKS